ncbi:putative helicase mov-10-B.1 [Polymixia lowei]
MPLLKYSRKNRKDQGRGRLNEKVQEADVFFRDQIISDKHGVTIISDPEAKEGRICLTVYQHEVVHHLHVNSANSVYFIQYDVVEGKHFVDLYRGKPIKLEPGKSCEIRVRFRFSQVGCYHAALNFEFKSSTTFRIGRFFEVYYLTALGKDLAPTAQYKRRSKAFVTPRGCRTVTCRPLERGDAVRLKTEVPLREYKLPNNIGDIVKFLNNILVSNSPELNNAKILLDSPLTSENYSQRFKLLLHLEEHAINKDIDKYSMADTPMFRDKRNNNLLILQVPGVSESRPAVLCGDQVLVRPSEDSGGTEYQGHVHLVEEDWVKLVFHKKLLKCFVEGMKFNVKFAVNRLTMRIQLRAAKRVAEKHRLKKLLLPTWASSSNQQPELHTFSPVNPDVKENPEQYKAVQNIVAGSSKPAPYIVFGPPGTGKTVTVVEAIKQIVKEQASCRILACAPSNSAADLLWKGIRDNVENVFRLYALSCYGKNKIKNTEPQYHCNLQDSIAIPSKAELMPYKVIVTTLLTASRLVTGGLVDHYTHVFVDEAGQAPETQCIIPLTGTAQVVLAGDPKQLGPILKSSLALKYGLGVSLLERLMKDIEAHRTDEKRLFDNHFVTKLVRNYRSHPKILEVPNKLFYDEELLCHADLNICNSFCAWKYLPTQGFPLIFHEVMGIEEREANCPSFFNRAEVEKLMNYVEKVLQTPGEIQPKDIGIITPYRKQVEKIRKALKTVGKRLAVNMENLKVGTVEDFQGEERRVILVSTVRSNDEDVELDKESALGFVADEKRFNVVMTRAQALLIVVGNSKVLKTDTNWKRFIEHCCSHGGYIGIEHSYPGQMLVMERMSRLSIKRHGGKVETEESEVQ